MITITDDGDESVYINVNGAKVYTLAHGPHGWDGMIAGIEAVKAVAEALGVEVDDGQEVA